VEVIRDPEGVPRRWFAGLECKGFYSYSPDVKYILQCEYDPDAVKGNGREVVNWELTSFQFNK
jgi:hypothetical protein